MGTDNTETIKSDLTGQKHDTRWKKGQSGNPNGRPEGSVSIVEGIKRKLLEIEPGNKKTYLELFLNKLFLKAIKDGNEQLMRDMINRVDGMPKQTVVGDPNEPLQVNHTFTDDQLERILSKRAETKDNTND